MDTINEERVCRVHFFVEGEALLEFHNSYFSPGVSREERVVVDPRDPLFVSPTLIVVRPTARYDLWVRPAMEHTLRYIGRPGLLWTSKLGVVGDMIPATLVSVDCETLHRAEHRPALWLMTLGWSGLGPSVIHGFSEPRPLDVDSNPTGPEWDRPPVPSDEKAHEGGSLGPE
jgi:hypothetical protein